MAEFMNQVEQPALCPMNMMGKPIPFSAREEGYQHCKEMGLDQARAYECVSAVSEALERDKPYEAMEAATRFLDLTGAYRVMAAILASAAAA